jgi:hypothetical protein
MGFKNKVLVMDEYVKTLVSTIVLRSDLYSFKVIQVLDIDDYNRASFY